MPKSYTLHEAREFFLVDAGCLRSSMGCAFGMIADMQHCPEELRGPLKELCYDMTRGKLTAKQLDKTKETARKAAWKYLHLGRHVAAKELPKELRDINQEKEKVAGSVMMILDSLTEAPTTSHMRRRVPLGRERDATG